MTDIRVRRLGAGDREHARNLFVLMAGVFGEEVEPLGDDYLDRLLAREDFWAVAAFAGDEIAGGVTAHRLPMTRTESSEAFIYDVAVHPAHQRRGVGRRLIGTLLEEARAAGIGEAFVPAEEEDRHALDFYRAVGGLPSRVVFFTFPHE